MASKSKSKSKPAGKSRPRRETPLASRALSAFSIGALAVAAGAVLIEVARRFARPGDAGHVPTDLMRDTHPGPHDRAIDAFRPDPTAPVPPGEREALRPAPG
jgi:hypothetical protein